MPKRKKRTGAERKGVLSFGAAPFVCPDCSGPLFPAADGPGDQLQCLVGHSYAPESLSEAHREGIGESFTNHYATFTRARQRPQTLGQFKEWQKGRPKGTFSGMRGSRGKRYGAFAGDF